MSNLSIYLPTYLSTCLSIYLPIYLSIYLDLSNIYIYVKTSHTSSSCQDFVLGVHRCGCEHRATFPALRVDDLLRCFFLWRANAGGENPMVYVITITKTTYNL